MVLFTDKDGARDPRGFSYLLDDDVLGFIGTAHNIHVATVAAKNFRGNHFHEKRKEVLFVLQGCPWSFHWDEGPGTNLQARAFSGLLSTCVFIQPGSAHALVNRGIRELIFVGLSDLKYDPSQPDAFRRDVFDPE